MEPRIQKTRTYDFLCVLKGTVTRDANEGVLADLKTIIEREGGKLLQGQNHAAPRASDRTDEVMAGEPAKDEVQPRTEARQTPPLQARRLAYAIERETNAFMATFEFQGLPELPQRLQAALRHNPHILRCLLTQKIKRPRKHPKPKAVPTRTFRDTSTGAPESAAQLMDPPRAPSPETVREPIPQLSPEDIDKKIEEIIG